MSTVYTCHKDHLKKSVGTTLKMMDDLKERRNPNRHKGDLKKRGNPSCHGGTSKNPTCYKCNLKKRGDHVEDHG